jgi:hypothetical protein
MEYSVAHSDCPSDPSRPKYLKVVPETFIFNLRHLSKGVCADPREI